MRPINQSTLLSFLSLLVILVSISPSAFSDNLVTPEQLLGQAKQSGASSTELQAYLADTEFRIKSSWLPQPGTETARVVVEFKINKDGRAIDVQVVKSSEVPSVDEAAIIAVNHGSPFKSLPLQLGDFCTFEMTFSKLLAVAHNGESDSIKILRRKHRQLHTHLPLQ
jgi:TonB family protein